MAEHDQNTEHEKKSTMRLPLAGAALVTTEIAGAMLHGGPLGVGAGVLAAAFAYFKGQDLLDLGKSLLPESVHLPEWASTSGQGNGERSFMDRLLARYPDEQEQQHESGDKEESDEEDEAVQESLNGRAEAQRELEQAQRAAGLVPLLICANERRRLHMAPNFQPDANDVVKTGLVAFGIPGSGKTSVLVRCLEQLVTRFNLPCVIFDSQGDFLSLVEDGVFTRGWIAVPGRVPSPQTVIAQGLQVVFDLSEWHKPGAEGMDKEMAGTMMQKYINALMAVQKAIEPAKRRTCPVVIDEVHLWVPQGRTPGGMTPATAATVYNAVMAIATTGRKLGLPPLVAGQRIATIHNDVIGNIGIRLFGLADLDNDLKRYREYFSEEVATDAQIRAFHAGEMIVCMSGKKVHVQFLNRESRHESHTPSVTTGLEQFKHRLSPEVLAALVQGQEVSEEEEGVVDFDEEEPIEELQPKPQVGKYDQAIKTWRDLESKQMANVRDFAAAMGLGETKAYSLLCEMDRLGLIEWERRKKKAQ